MLQFSPSSCSFFLVSLGGVRLSPLGASATVGILYQPRMIDDDDYGAVGGMRIGWGYRSTRRKPAPVPLCPPQIPHDLTWDRTRAAAVGSQRLTVRAMARPRPRVTSSILGPNILLGTLFSDTFSLLFPLRDKPCFTPIQNFSQNYSFVYSDLYAFR
jgi:hypothetical protein